MVYDSIKYNNDFILEALETIGNLNNIAVALDNYRTTLMKIIQAIWFLPTVTLPGNGIPPCQMVITES